MEKFTESDFTSLFLYYMSKNGVDTIKADELSKKLVVYRTNEKYRNLFSDIALSRGLVESVDIYESISSLKQWGGLWYTSLDRDTLHINLNEKAVDYHFEGKDETDLALLQEMACHFGIRNKAERLAKGKLNIYGINPNKWYYLVDGMRYNRITWQLVTDGILEENILKNGEKEIYYDDPTNLNHSWIGLENAVRREIKINDASFTIKQGLVDGKVKAVELNTESIDENYLLELAEYSFNDSQINGRTLTKENPNVYSLKLKR